MIIGVKTLTGVFDGSLPFKRIRDNFRRIICLAFSTNNKLLWEDAPACAHALEYICGMACLMAHYLLQHSQRFLTFYFVTLGVPLIQCFRKGPMRRRISSYICIYTYVCYLVRLMATTLQMHSKTFSTNIFGLLFLHHYIVLSKRPNGQTHQLIHLLIAMFDGSLVSNAFQTMSDVLFCFVFSFCASGV